MDAIAFNAPEVNAYDSFKTKWRELIARANMLFDLFVFHREPKFLGEKVSIPIWFVPRRVRPSSDATRPRRHPLLPTRPYHALVMDVAFR
jgi:vancomycin permeability regulator SanA